MEVNKVRVLVDKDKNTHVYADNGKVLLVDRFKVLEVIFKGNNVDISRIKEISDK